MSPGGFGCAILECFLRDKEIVCIDEIGVEVRVDVDKIPRSARLTIRLSMEDFTFIDGAGLIPA